MGAGGADDIEFQIEYHPKFKSAHMGTSRHIAAELGLAVGLS
jgi:hypothetical protein